ncbi:polymer-forming cytoskeletal protein [Alkalibacterium putridalgicola]|uniref:polymer-forming cytoskeletal protein n=1 Tax=Alkalibacterium putridalgicola TaxID=426703 RepID=UPI0034CDD7C3
MSLLKKKLAAGAAVVALGGFLGACDSSEDTPEETTEETTEETGDAVTAASITDQADEVVASLSEDGNWITAITADVTVEEDITVAGTFHDGGDEAEAEYRKLALYAQDEDRNVTDEYTLTVPMMTVESPNFRIQNGTVDGDVYVDAEGFELAGSTVTGDVTFASQELQDAAMMDEGTVEGEVTVEE